MSYKHINMSLEPRKLIAEQAPYQVWLQKGIPEHIIQFLETVHFGTDGAIYSHLKTAERIAQIEQAYVAYATEGDRFVACMVMSRAQTWQGPLPLDSYYIRYFSAHPDYQGKGITKQMSQLFIPAFAKTLPKGALLYAALEGDNHRSIKIVEKVGFGYPQPVSTIGFSRFFPKGSPNIQPIRTEAEKAEVIALLETFYAEYSIRHFSNIHQHDNYFVIRKGGEIVAGLQMHHAIWRIENMPGLSGKLLLHVVPRLPVLNKMMNPNHFEFLSFEGIYYQLGHEDALFELMEGLLAMEKLKTAVFWVAKESPVADTILHNGKLGLMHLFVKDARTYITYNTTKLNEEEKAQLLQYQPYISSFDFI